jgi:hypothetical protein
VTEEKHTLSRDEKGRKSERGKDRRQRKSTHFLETKWGGEVSEARMGDRGKARTSYGPMESPQTSVLMPFNVDLSRTFAFITISEIPFILGSSVPCWNIIIHWALSSMLHSHLQ